LSATTTQNELRRQTLTPLFDSRTWHDEHETIQKLVRKGTERVLDRTVSYQWHDSVAAHCKYSIRHPRGNNHGWQQAERFVTKHPFALFLFGRLLGLEDCTDAAYLLTVYKKVLKRKKWIQGGQHAHVQAQA
jgi:hypothetical protein